MLWVGEVEYTDHLGDTRLPWNLQRVRNCLLICAHAGDQHHLAVCRQRLINSYLRSDRASAIATWTVVFAVLLDLDESQRKLFYLFKACDLLLICLRVVNLLRSCLRCEYFMSRVMAGVSICLIFIDCKHYTWIVDGVHDALLRRLLAV